MSDWQVPLSAVRLTDADIEAANEVYRSGWLSMGPRTEELERAFVEYAGSGHCLRSRAAPLACTSRCWGRDWARRRGPGAMITFVATPTPSRTPARVPSSPISRRLTAPGSHPRRPSARSPRPRRRSSRSPTVVTPVRLRHCEIWLFTAISSSSRTPPTRPVRGWATATWAARAGRRDQLLRGEEPRRRRGRVLLTDDEELAERARLMRWHGVTRSIWSATRRIQSYDVPAWDSLSDDDARAASPARGSAGSTTTTTGASDRIVYRDESARWPASRCSGTRRNRPGSNHSIFRRHP